MGRPRKAVTHLQIDIGEDLKREYNEWCRKRGVLPAVALRKILRETIQSNAPLLTEKTSGEESPLPPLTARDLYFLLVAALMRIAGQRAMTIMPFLKQAMEEVEATLSTSSSETTVERFMKSRSRRGTA